MLENPVTVTDINIPFGKLVGIIMKIMLASIPAVVLFYVLMFLAWGAFIKVMSSGGSGW